MDAPGDRDARDVDDNLVGRFCLERRKRGFVPSGILLERNSFSDFRAWCFGSTAISVINIKSCSYFNIIKLMIFKL